MRDPINMAMVAVLVLALGIGSFFLVDTSSDKLAAAFVDALDGRMERTIRAMVKPEALKP